MLYHFSLEFLGPRILDLYIVSHAISKDWIENLSKPILFSSCPCAWLVGRVGHLLALPLWPQKNLELQLAQLYVLLLHCHH